MGSYDYRCLATGITLRGASCVAILIQRGEHGWRPASLPIRGGYNSYGTIDPTRKYDRTDAEDYLERALVQAVDDAVAEKRIMLGGDSKSAWKRSEARGLEKFLDTVERVGCDHGSVELGGQPISHTLIHASVFDAICAQHAEPTMTESASDLLERVMPVPLARWWYGDLARFPRADVQAALRAGLLQIAAFNAWLAENGNLWSPPPVFDGPGEQHSLREMLASFREARSHFGDVPWLRKPLNAIGRRLEEFDGPAGWMTEVDVSWYAIAIGAQRIACTQIDGLGQRIADAFYDWSELLATEAAELLVIDRGDITTRIDLRPYLCVRDAVTGVTTPITNVAACEELLTRPGDNEMTIELVDLPALPALRAPIIATRNALLIAPDPPPPWLAPDERYAAVIRFSFD